MNQKNFEKFVTQNRINMEKPFHAKQKVWEQIQKDLTGSKSEVTVLWWKPLSGVAVAAVLGLLAVWCLHQYNELTSLSSEMAHSVEFYETSEIRLIKNISKQNLAISPDIRHDLKEIDDTQKLLKKALQHAPENKKEWIYSSLIETYEIKINLLEQIIYFDHLKQDTKQHDETAL